MANQLDAIGNAKDMLPAFINAGQAAMICGRRSSEWTYSKLRDDKTFPCPLNGRTGPGGAKMIWRRQDVEQWAAKEKVGKAKAADELPPSFAGEMAVQFIAGLFDPPHALAERQRRIERARQNGVKNNQLIRIGGDWL